MPQAVRLYIVYLLPKIGQAQPNMLPCLADMQAIDTHAHLDFPDFAQDLPQVVARARAAGVGQIVSIGCRPQAWARTQEIARQFDGVHAALGVHPCDVHKKTLEDMQHLQTIVSAENSGVVALGETGFDCFRDDHPPLVMQTEAFFAHAELAKGHDLPIIVHLRAANQPALNAFPALKKMGVWFVVHCFSGSVDFARAALDAGGHLSFTGIITFKNLDADTRQALQTAPADRIFFETDAPYLSPVPHRGKRCESAFVPHIIQAAAAIRGATADELCQQSTANAKAFFGI